MSYYVTRNSSPTSDRTFSSIDEAVASIPSQWAVGQPTDLDLSYGSVGAVRAVRFRGEVFSILAGVNPTAARREAATASASRKPGQHRPYSGTPGWLSREMNREDSDY